MKNLFSAVLFIFISISCQTQTDQNKKTEFMISTSSQSNDRVKKVLSTEGSEDKSDLLNLIYNAPQTLNKPDSTRYFANEKFDWIITINPKENGSYTKDQINSVFTRDWRKKMMYPTIYCMPNNSNNWTYLMAADNNANSFKKVAIAWKLFDSLDDPPSTLEEELLETFFESVKKKTKELNAGKLITNYSTTEAALVSKKLSQLVTANNQWAIIVLKADQKFEGKDIWDVMMSVGLRWGDMDLFHWDNELDVGGDFVFSVWTSTSPGYFFPEEIAKGNVQTDDLIFGFSIPRSVDPEQIFNIMHNVTKYAQKRLGGKLLNENYLPLNVEYYYDKIEIILKNLEKESLKSGVGNTLYLFQ
ncbi:MAG: cell division protein ZipA C-terminal FtsZ-binding domain-containing protein [bacterium]